MINLYLIAIIVTASLIIKPENKKIMALWSLITLVQTLFYYFDCMIYLSAFLADFVILSAAVREKGAFSLKLSTISLCFMIAHFYGYMCYLAYVLPDTYNNCLTCLYVILLFEVVTDGGMLNGVKALVKHLVHGVVNCTRAIMDLYEGNL